MRPFKAQAYGWLRRGTFAESIMIDVRLVEPATPSYWAEGSHLREEIAVDIMIGLRDGGVSSWRSTVMAARHGGRGRWWWSATVVERRGGGAPWCRSYGRHHDGTEAKGV